MWELIHDESITANENLSIWYRESENLDKFVLFEMNKQGLTVAYYHNAFDAIDGRFPAAEICYGWDVLQVENREKDAFLTRISVEDEVYEKFGKSIVTCDHDFTCDEILHAAQVVLGNEECDGCEPCARYGKEGVGA